MNKHQIYPVKLVSLLLLAGIIIWEFSLVTSAYAQTPVDNKTESTAIELLPIDGDGILKTVSESKAKVVMVNVWATWCQPCVEEFPDMMRIYREYKDQGLELMLVSADFKRQESGVRKFLLDYGVDFPVYIKVADDMEFINTLQADWSGALPATILYDQNGVKRNFWFGKASYGKFKQAVEEVLTINNKDK